MLTVTADTNLYVSALVFGGKPLEFLERARAGEIDLTVSEDIIAEVAHVLRDKFGWETVQVARAYDIIIGCARVVEPTERLRVVREDPDDDRILECAVAARAHVLITGDLDLRHMREFRGIRIVPLAELGEILDS